MRLSMPLSVAVVAALLLSSRHAAGQSAAPRVQGSYQRNAAPSNPALKYFTGEQADPAVRARPAAASPARPAAAGRVAKPFENVRRDPLVSPYLALDVNGGITGVPAYYAFVQPQLEQMRENQMQRNQSMRLQQQMRATSATAPGSVEPVGYTARFLNSGGYFPSLR